jgi:hypothetical protein
VSPSFGGRGGFGMVSGLGDEVAAKGGNGSVCGARMVIERVSDGWSLREAEKAGRGKRCR